MQDCDNKILLLLSLLIRNLPKSGLNIHSWNSSEDLLNILANGPRSPCVPLPRALGLFSWTVSWCFSGSCHAWGLLSNCFSGGSETRASSWGRGLRGTGYVQLEYLSVPLRMHGLPGPTVPGGSQREGWRKSLFECRIDNSLALKKMSYPELLNMQEKMFSFPGIWVF